VPPLDFSLGLGTQAGQTKGKGSEGQFEFHVSS
jgi:hypothetical protein